jgi:ribosome-binding factor A
VAAPLRIKRLEHQICAKVDSVLRQEISDPRLGFVTITGATLSRDLETCDIRWSTLDDAKKRVLSEKALESARGYVQRAVAVALELRTAPHLRFHFDEGFAAAMRVQDLIGKARAEDEARRTGKGSTDAPKVQGD